MRWKLFENLLICDDFNAHKSPACTNVHYEAQLASNNVAATLKHNIKQKFTELIKYLVS